MSNRDVVPQIFFFFHYSHFIMCQIIKKNCVKYCDITLLLKILKIFITPINACDIFFFFGLGGGGLKETMSLSTQNNRSIGKAP